MNNDQAAALFNELADILDLAGELPFKSASYRKAAQSLLILDEPFHQIVSRGDYSKVLGAGKAIKEKLMALALTQKLPALEKWRQHKIASFLPAIKKYELKPRALGMLAKRLDATDLDDLIIKLRSAEMEKFIGQVKETALKILER